MEIKQAEFLITVAEENKLITNLKNEFAFVGRSNVGKSSLINALTRQAKLAKTSSTPGKTKLVNYFSINNGQFHIVDLPGYGYHEASKQDEEKWVKLLESYFIKSQQLKCVFLLIDIRIDISPLDKIMIDFLVYRRIPFVVVLTKSDKLKRTEQIKQINLISSQIGIPQDNLIIVSAQYRLGINKILEKIDQYCN